MSAWVVKIEEELSRSVPERIQRRRMYRIPSTERFVDGDSRDVYRPYKVSVGPWYTLKEEKKKPEAKKPDEKKKEEEKKDSVSAGHWHPRSMGEEVKKDSLVHFLRRSGKPLESYLTALREVVDDLRDDYDGLHPKWRDDTQSFLEMMLLDGCFLLEFVYTMRDIKGIKSRSMDDSVNPIIMRVLENHEGMKRYVRDIMLLENQVPLMLLEKLHSVWTGDDGIEFLKVIAATFIPINRAPKIECIHGELRGSLHILDVYRRILVHRDFKRETPPEKKGFLCIAISRWRKPPSLKPQVEFVSTNIPAATELDEIGIGFTTSKSTSLLDISFQHNILKLPVIAVDGSTKSLFLNLIAFEQLHKNIVTRKEVTSYMYLMGCLVQDADDASLLQSHGIIITTLPPYEVTILFRRMCKVISLDPDRLDPEYIEMLRMVRARFNKLSKEWRKDLFQTHLKSPWAVMSVMAAILLFTLSIIQTVYTVLSYVRPK